MSMQMRYIVIFKDGPHDVPRYVGPFVSQKDAENLMRELPSPLPGGKVQVREMYGREMVPLIKELISRERTSLPKSKPAPVHA